MVSSDRVAANESHMKSLMTTLACFEEGLPTLEQARAGCMMFM